MISIGGDIPLASAPFFIISIFINQSNQISTILNMFTDQFSCLINRLITSKNLINIIKVSFKSLIINLPESLPL
jgi:hypothetical protein